MSLYCVFSIYYKSTHFQSLNTICNYILMAAWFFHLNDPWYLVEHLRCLYFIYIPPVWTSWSIDVSPLSEDDEVLLHYCCWNMQLLGPHGSFSSASGTEKPEVIVRSFSTPSQDSSLPSVQGVKPTARWIYWTAPLARFDFLLLEVDAGFFSGITISGYEFHLLLFSVLPPSFLYNSICVRVTTS